MNRLDIRSHVTIPRPWQNMLTHKIIHFFKGSRGTEGSSEIQGLTSAQQFNGQYFLHVLDDCQWFPGSKPTHGHVIFLRGRRGNGVHWCGMCQNLKLFKHQQPSCITILTLFSETSAAAVQWAIINPEWRPPFGVKNAGRPLNAGFTSRSTRRSEMDANSWMPMAK